MESGREADRAELVFAVVHEIGNQLGAIRLQAHLLDDDLDARGVRLEIETPATGTASGPSVAWLNPLWIALVQTTLSATPRPSSISIRVEPRDAESILRIEDDGGEEDLSESAARRERSLVVAIARCLLESDHGRVHVERDGTRTVVGLVFFGSGSGSATQSDSPPDAGSD